MRTFSLRNLITGGAGFVGSPLIYLLMDAQGKVIRRENFFTGS